MRFKISTGKWRRYSGDLPTLTTIPEHDPSAPPTTGFFSNIINSNFRWSKVVVFEPYKDGEPFGGVYHVGFISPAFMRPPVHSLYCTLELRDTIGMLLGPGKAEFFAYCKSGPCDFLELRMVEYVERSRLNSHIPLV